MGSLRRVCSSLGIDWGEDELALMIHEADTKKNGLINETEFRDILFPYWYSVRFFQHVSLGFDMSKNWKNKQNESRVSNPFGAAPPTSSFVGNPNNSAFGTFGSGFHGFGGTQTQSGVGAPSQNQTGFGATGFQSSQKNPFEHRQQAHSILEAFSANPNQQPTFGSVIASTSAQNILTPAKGVPFRISEPQFPSFVPRTSRSLVQGQRTTDCTDAELDIFRTKQLGTGVLIPVSPPPLELR